MTKFSQNIFVLIAFLSLFGWCSTGGAQVDSLLEVVQSLPDGEEKAKVYEDIAFSYYFSDPDKCIAYCDTLFALSQKVGYKKGISNHHYLKAIAYYIKEDNELALEHCTLALAHTRKYNFKDNELIVLNFMGTIYHSMGLYEKAIEYQLSSLKLSEEQGDTLGMAYANHNISTLYFDLGDGESTKEYTLAAIKWAKNTDEYHLLSNCYSTYSNTLEQPEERLEMLNKAMYYAQLTGSQYHAISIYQNYASYYEKLNQIDEAIKNARAAFSLSEEFEEVYQYTESASSLGSYYLKKDQLDSATYFLETAKDVARANDYKIELEDTYFYLSELNQKMGSISEAFNYLQLAYITRDSIYNEEITTQLQLNSAKYEFEKNQRIISEQQLKISEETRKRNRLVFILLLVLAVVSGAYQWYLRRQQRRKQEAEIALAQQTAESNRLRELDELKTNFFTNISHELRTPLTLILSPLADLQEQVKSVAVRDKLSIIKNNAQRLLGLVNEILDLAKVEAGKLNLQKSRVSLHFFVKRIFFSFESMAEIRRIGFELDLQLEEQYLLIDRDKLETILHNLLSNAIKYTSAGGKVSMKVYQQGADITFEVADTGQGIDTEDLPRIFDRFYQVRQDRLQGGTGVGLALSKELAELMEGRLQVASEIGRGSVFTLSFPLENAPELQGAELSEIKDDEEAVTGTGSSTVFAPIAIAGEKPRLLIVEDNPDMGKYLVQILSEHYQCVLATDGQEAIKQLKLSRFDCITSDVMMPNMDGFEFREAINEEKEWRQIPFLLLTARHLEDDKIRGLQLGVDDYVTKPFSTLELQARIHNLISNKLERDAFSKEEKAADQEPKLNVDQKFLKQAENAVIERLSDVKFGVEDLAKAVNYSSKQLGRLLKKHTGMTTVNFILEVRLQKARLLLEKRLCATVMEAQLEVGISSTSYFTKKFTDRFGKNPSEFIQ
ncbi:MAG: response regulator [Phaeodactylibacter sp.]|nr:response regulator [Phaeodactylibacter sp.]